MTGEELREAFRAIRDQMPEEHRVRLHRAISWYRCAEDYSESDDDVSFIALWVSLNSCYAIDDDDEQSIEKRERNRFRRFASILAKQDEEGKRIYNCLWDKFPSFVRLLIEDQHLFRPFWKCRLTGDESWKDEFSRSKTRAFTALGNSHLSPLLCIVFDRLYELRNQLVHGGSTYRSSMNREQVVNGKRMLMEILPVVIEQMFDHSLDWGQIRYSPVEEDH